MRTLVHIVRSPSLWRLGAFLLMGLPGLFLGACGQLTGVGIGPAESGYEGEGAIDPGDATGSAAFRISLAPVVKALAKKSDTSITLDTLHLLLSSPGLPSRKLELPVSEDIAISSQVRSTTLNGLQALRNWKVKVWTRDVADSVIHIDSTTFYVGPGDTAAVSMSLYPTYSILVARFVSTSNSVTPIEKLVLMADGVVVDDTTFAKKVKIFDMKLSHKYLKAGAVTTLELLALDRASPPRIRYSRSLILTPNASGDTTVTVQLD